MARRAVAIGPGVRIGGAVALLILLLILAPLLAVALRAEGAGRLGAADWAAIRFTVWQAILSAMISCALAVPLARALARRSFPGRALIVTLLGAPFLLPALVAILGLLAVFGRNGALSGIVQSLGLPPLSIYGLHGVVLAHVFFNLPLATRVLLQGWLAIPSERFRLAASLGATPADIARLLERPMLREVLPGAFATIFLVCLTSFAVALTLGGGPGATTIELAIYQAFRFQFDLGRAALLGLVQIALTAAAALAALRLALPAGLGGGLDRPAQSWAAGPVHKMQDAAIVTLASAFLLFPLAAVVTAGLPTVATLPPVVWHAAARSLAVALGSAAFTLALALPLAMLAHGLQGRPGKAAEALGYLPIAVSPLVLGTGLFVILNPVVRPADLALPVTALVNATLALPFALRALLPALRDAEQAHGRLADSLNLHRLSRLRLMILPRLARPIGFSLGLSAAFSMGDLGVIALFADPQNGTLPFQLHALMGAYRMDDAAGAALLLMALSLGLFMIFDRGGRLGPAT
jgi:thiamine transport system permease protein